MFYSIYLIGVNPLNGGSASRKRPHASEAQSRKGTANDRTLNNKDSSAGNKLINIYF